MATIDLSSYPAGTVLRVECRDGVERTVVVSAFGGDYCGSYPHRLNDANGNYEDSVTNQGRIRVGDNDSQDIIRILTDEASRPRPVARGFRRADLMPSDEHGSDEHGQILWRDSNDNELVLRDVDSPPAACFDQWFPLAQLDFQVQEISESLKAHKEAYAAWKDASSDVARKSFVKGYLKAKGVDFNERDFEAAS